jgi:hypothetical protein
MLHSSHAISCLNSFHSWSILSSKATSSDEEDEEEEDVGEGVYTYTGEGGEEMIGDEGAERGGDGAEEGEDGTIIGGEAILRDKRMDAGNMDEDDDTLLA